MAFVAGRDRGAKLSKAIPSLSTDSPETTYSANSHFTFFASLLRTHTQFIESAESGFLPTNSAAMAVLPLALLSETSQPFKTWASIGFD